MAHTGKSGSLKPGTKTNVRDAAAAARSSRTIALVGPYLSGKTTLLEAILARTGAIARAGRVGEGTTTGDASPEAKAHGMSVELSVAGTTFLDDAFTFIDCPGSIEFQFESSLALTAADAAVVVCEPDEKRVPALQVILKHLEDIGLPHFLFLNKIDSVAKPVRDILPMLQPASAKPLVLRQIPVWENGIATGFVDLASERAYLYREHSESQIIPLPMAVKDRESQARFHMLEQLADYDDALMEQLLSDLHPPKDKIFDDLARDLREGLICPVLLGSAANGNGIMRLLKALRHEVPFVTETARRLKLENTSSAAYVLKTVHTTHGGKLSIARVLRGAIAEGTLLTLPDGREERVAGVLALRGAEALKRGPAAEGDTVALARLENARTGQTLTTAKSVLQARSPAAPEPVFGTALVLADRAAEVKLSAALLKLTEEDPALKVEHDADAHQIVLLGQGEMHLRVAVERLKRKYGIAVERRPRAIAYRETIARAVELRGRHKKQSGGHGQYGDVVVRIEPRGRGEGFQFSERVTGGAVPRQFFSSVEMGVRDYLRSGPLGFPVVDVGVTLLDGSAHSVDSSDMAFRAAGRLAMSEGMPKCAPLLLEPVMAVEIAVPSDHTARINAIIAGRRGQILGFDARSGWPGWDVVSARLPAAEMDDLIVELRSATAGVATFSQSFDHLAELSGRLADGVLAAHKAAAE